MPFSQVAGTTLLHLAAMNSCEKLVRKLLEKKANAKARNASEVTPLHCACECGNFEIVKLLLDKAAEIHAKTGKGMTPLHLACEHGHAAIVSFLLLRGASVHAVNGEGLTPLALASLHNYDTIVKDLNAHIAFLENAPAATATRPSQIPIRPTQSAGSVPLVTMITMSPSGIPLTPGSMPNLSTQTPSPAAIAYKAAAVVSPTPSSRAAHPKGSSMATQEAVARDEESSNSSDSNDETLVAADESESDQEDAHIAEKGSMSAERIAKMRAGLSKVLIIRQELFELCKSATTAKDLARMEELFENGAKVDFKNSWKETLLHKAARANNAKVVKLLLEWGADKSLKSRAGKLPKDCTTNDEVLKLLDKDWSKVEKRKQSDKAAQPSTLVRIPKPAQKTPPRVEGQGVSQNTSIGNEMLQTSPRVQQVTTGSSVSSPMVVDAFRAQTPVVQALAQRTEAPRVPSAVIINVSEAQNHAVQPATPGADAPKTASPLATDAFRAQAPVVQALAQRTEAPRVPSPVITDASRAQSPVVQALAQAAHESGASSSVVTSISKSPTPVVQALAPQQEITQPHVRTFSSSLMLLVHIRDGNKQAIEDLIKSGVDVNTRFYPLHEAIKMGDKNMVQLLLDRGALCEEQDQAGNNGLHLALLTRQHDIAMLLIERNAPLNCQNKQGLTALMIAADIERIDIIALLLTKKADQKLKDASGKTYLDHLSANLRTILSFAQIK